VLDLLVKKKLKKEELIKHLHKLGIETGGTSKNYKNFARSTNYQLK
jgi:hypothetical protein